MMVMVIVVVVLMMVMTMTTTMIVVVVEAYVLLTGVTSYLISPVKQLKVTGN